MTVGHLSSADPGKLDVSGQVVLVTGAALGIGRALAQGFAVAGARVVVNYRSSASAAEELVQAIHSDGGEAVAIRADVRDPDEVRALVCAANEHYGAIDCLINNAAVNRQETAIDTAPTGWSDVIRTGLDGAFYCSRAVVERSMAERRRGTIVNVSSISALVGHRGISQASYHAAKAGLNGLTRATALEWAPLGVRVNALCPGFVETPMLKAAFASDPERFAGVIADTPMARLATPEEMVAPAMFLASTASSFMTGQCLVVDGGYTAW